MSKCLAALILCCATLFPSSILAECRSSHVELRGGWGQAAFAVEIADTPDKRSRGLMFREQMARGSGMLFVYEYPQRASFWMKNTLIPLDIIFTDQSGLVTRVHSNAIPGDLTQIPGGDEVFAVLEINAGLAARYGVSEGTELRHPIFAKGLAKWPC